MIFEDIEWLIGKRERAAVKESLDLKSIPQPQILIKDHNLENEEGNFPTRFLVGANNFALIF